MDRIVVKELLSPKEKDRRAAQYQAWLQEHGYSTTPTSTPDLTALEQGVVRLQMLGEQLLAEIQIIKAHGK